MISIFETKRIFSNTNISYCVTQQACFKCIQDNEDETCHVCGVRHFQVWKYSKRFRVYATVPRIGFSKITLITHNMISYDGQFILKHMNEIMKWTEKVIMSGLKIHSNSKIIDSLNFFNTRLADLPKMFDLNVESKGYFLHFLNKQGNWQYSNELPVSVSIQLRSNEWKR